MGMGKKKKKEEEEDPRPQLRLPRNTVTWSLDGNPDEVRASFEASQNYFRYWHFCRGQYRVRIGNMMIYTGPLDGTFYYLVRYQGRFVVFIIVVRQYWLIGIWNSHGFFQARWEDNLGFYMDNNNTVCTGFGLNHKDVGEGVDRTKLGIWNLRDAHDALSSYQGPNRPEPEGFREAWDTFIVFIMETKYLEILNKCCSKMDGFDRLGNRARILIMQWRSFCKKVMTGIDQGFETQQDLDEAYQLMNAILIYHVDAYREGQIFRHPSLPPKPREETWAPIDEGEGDGDIQNPDAAAPLPEAPLRPQRIISTNARRGRKRRSIQLEDKDGKRPRRECRGLRGGGVGGSAEVPPWFLQWRQEIGNEKVLNQLVTSAKKELGLMILDAPALHLKQTIEEDMQDLQLKDENRQPSRSDVKDITDGGFIGDGVISQYFQQLQLTLDNQVTLVSPATSFSFAHDTTAMDVALFSLSQITILSVNNSTSHEPDRGSHWSVLVLYNPHGGTPRLVHHDNTDPRNNEDAAERLVNSIRSVLPPFSGTLVEHVESPLQQNGVDCAVFVMAITYSIARWWGRVHQGQQQQQGDWLNTLMRDVDQNVVTQMRNLLPRLLEGGMTVEELNSKCFFSGDGDDDKGENEIP